MDNDDFEAFLAAVEDEGAAYSRKFRRADVLVVGLNFTKRLIGAFYHTASELTELVAMHANYEVDREAFAEEAALEIESLVSGEEESDG